MPIFTTIGLMSGTSMDGIDAALLETDGKTFIEPKGFFFRPYGQSFKNRLQSILGQHDDPDGRIADVEEGLTERHIETVQSLLEQENIAPEKIDLIGFHGHTIFHNPAKKFTWQIGNGRMLARKTGIDVIYNLRQSDVQNGGQGAPLAPIYHWALAQNLGMLLPCVFLNIGGVANITFVTKNPEDMIAFDTGPGNALIDDTMRAHFGQEFDQDGKIASQGKIIKSALKQLLAHEYFQKAPPKSLDRNDFHELKEIVSTLAPEDQVATLTAFTAFSIAKALDHVPQKPLMWITAGGGRHNPVLMEWLGRISDVEPRRADELGINGDALEAQLFGYLAARSKLGLPYTYSKTTGIDIPLSGGVFVSKNS